MVVEVQRHEAIWCPIRRGACECWPPGPMRCKIGVGSVSGAAFGGQRGGAAGDLVYASPLLCCGLLLRAKDTLGNSMRALPLAITVAALAALPSWGQSLSPLAELDGGKIESSYPLVRCAAFYLASTEWTGAERMGPKAFATFEQTFKHLMAVAVLARVKAGSGNVEQMIEVTNRDARNIADLYRKRSEANYATNGQAWGNDALWLSDSKHCQIISNGAANIR